MSAARIDWPKRIVSIPLSATSWAIASIRGCGSGASSRASSAT
jgi:hypothetical protein